MTFCSCHLWVNFNYLCAYYMAICYMAGMKETAQTFALGVAFSAIVGDLHIKTSLGVAA